MSRDTPVALGGSPFIASDPVPSLTGVKDEYNPLRPNDYEEIMKKKRDQKQKERDEEERKRDSRDSREIRDTRDTRDIRDFRDSPRDNRDRGDDRQYVHQHTCLYMNFDIQSFICMELRISELLFEISSSKSCYFTE
jgi:hypothetical protein